MPVPKRNFTATYMDNKIYIIGGETENNSHSAHCEVYDLKTRRWERIDSLNEGVTNPIIVAFNDRYLFKFGGINRFGFIDKTVERYNTFRD